MVDDQTAAPSPPPAGNLDVPSRNACLDESLGGGDVRE